MVSGLLYLKWQNFQKQIKLRAGRATWRVWSTILWISQWMKMIFIIPSNTNLESTDDILLWDLIFKPFAPEHVAQGCVWVNAYNGKFIAPAQWQQSIHTATNKDTPSQQTTDTTPGTQGGQDSADILVLNRVADALQGLERCPSNMIPSDMCGSQEMATTLPLKWAPKPQGSTASADTDECWQPMMKGGGASTKSEAGTKESRRAMLTPFWWVWQPF